MNTRQLIPVTLLLLLAGCGAADREADGGAPGAGSAAAPLVVTSTYPLYYFANRIMEGVEGAPAIEFPEIEGDPAAWTPTPEQIQVLQSADVIILNGAGAEPWLDLVTIDRRKLVDTTDHIKDRLIPLAGTVVHQHGPEGEHSHQGTAHTTWIDPLLAVAQAQALTDAVARFVPEKDAQLRSNLAKLERDLMQLDTQLSGAFRKLGESPVLLSHPVYHYLERRYSINGQSVHWEPDEEPSTSDWIELQQIQASHRATIMIWEDEPMESTRRRLADLGIVSITFRTAANNPQDGEYFSVMLENVHQLDASLREIRIPE